MAKAWLKSLVAAMGLLGASQSVVANTSNYTVYTNAAGDIYLKAPEQFVLIHSDVSIPLFTMPADGYLKVINTGNGKWETVAISAAEWNSLGLYQGGNTVESLQYVDMNGDGTADMFLALRGGGYLVLYRKKDGTFATLASPAGVRLGTTFELKDVNGDGLLDVVSDGKVVSYGLPTFNAVYSDLLAPEQQANHVGMTAGSFRVDESGQATYSIPLAIPAGIAGVQPQVALNYSSGAGMGIVGMGWSLSGSSSISRCGKTIVQDGYNQAPQFNSNDAFCLDGQRMVLISGSYGATNSIYRLELDDFSRIKVTSANATGPQTFQLINKANETHNFGAGTSTQIAPGKSIASAWAVSSISDSFNNTINFSYYQNGVDGKTPGNFLLKEISYAGGTAKVIPSYQVVNSPKAIFVNGQEVLFKYRMDFIKVVGDANRSPYTYRFYHLGHQDNQFSYLNTVQECLAEGKVTTLPSGQTDTVGSECKKELLFAYSGVGNLIVSTSQSTTATVPSSVPMSASFADIDGDGRLDYFYPEGSSLRNFLASSNAINKTVTSQLDANNPRYTFADINGDGITDILYVANGKWRFKYYGPRKVARTCSPTSSEACYALQSRVASDYSEEYSTNINGYTEAVFADVNGDGLVDWVVPNERKLDVYKNLGGSFETVASTIAEFPASAWPTIDLPDIIASQHYIEFKADSIGDFNGDGNSDLLVKLNTYLDIPDVDEEGNPRVSSTSTSASAVLHNKNAATPNFSLEVLPYTVHAPKLVDMNADGLVDIVDNQNDGFIYLLSKGTETASFAAPIAISTPTKVVYKNKHLFQFMDVNADGAVDLVGPNIAPAPIAGWPANYLGVRLGANDKTTGRWGLTTTTVQLPVSDSKNALTDNVTTQWADADGDGDLDLFKRANNDSVWSIYNSNVVNGDPVHKISRIHNGFGAITTISYSKAYDPQVFTPARAVLASGTLNPDLIAPQAGMSLVKEVSSETRRTSGYVTEYDRETGTRLTTKEVLSDTVSVGYQYSGFLLHKKGRGALGFNQLTTIDKQTGIKTTTTYHQDWPFTGRPKETIVATADGKQISRATTTWATKKVADDGDFVYLQSSTEQGSQVTSTGSIAPIKKVETTNEFDSLKTDATAWGNLTKTVVKQYGYVGDKDTETLLLTTTTNNQYEGWNTTNSKRFGRLSKAEVTQSQAAVPGLQELSDHTRSSLFTYNSASGLLESEEIGSECRVAEVSLTARPATGACDQSNWRKTTYSYNSVGLKTQTKLETTHGTRFDSVQYSADNRFVIAKSDGASGDPTANVETYLYNGSTSPVGRIYETVVTGPNKLLSLTRYNAWGEAAESVDATGVTAYSWLENCENSELKAYCGEFDEFITRTKRAGTPAQAEITDMFGRVSKKLAVGFDGTWKQTTVAFDAQGRLVEEFQAEAATSGSPTAKFTSYSYDSYGRLAKTTNPDSSTVEVKYLGATTSTKDEEGFWRDEVRDGLGRTVFTSDPYAGTKPALLGGVKQSYDAYGNNVRTDVLAMVDSSGKPAVGNNGVRVDIKVTETASFDRYGRRLSSTSPSKGTWYYGYNGFGELISQQNGRGQLVTNSYDRLGRLLESNSVDGKVCYSYGTDPSKRNVGKLIELRSFSKDTACNTSAIPNYRETYAFDELGRPSATETLQKGKLFHQMAYYDALGRMYKQVLPGGVNVKQEYNAAGYQYQTIADGTIISEIKAMDDAGRVTQADFVGGSKRKVAYMPERGFIKNIEVQDGLNKTLYTVDYGYSLRGDTKSRLSKYSNGTSSTIVDENYTYSSDGHFRLEQRDVAVTAPQVLGNLVTPMSQSFSYDSLGNLKTKSGVGTYEYDSANPYLLRKTTGAAAGVRSYAMNSATDYDAHGNIKADGQRTFAYNQADMVTSITKGIDSTKFEYAPDNSRIYREDTRSGSVTKTWYVGKTYEYSEKGSDTEQRWYLGNVVMSQSSKASGTNFEVLHGDAQGSTVTVTDGGGELVSHSLYDAWGQQSVLQVGPTSQLFIQSLQRRGYTGHENVEGLGIIHMNGRIYDPLLARFVQADPTLQFAQLSQGYNRYSYVLNNPMTYTDPSGYFVFSAFKFVKNGIRGVIRALGAELSGMLVAIGSVFCGPYYAACVAAGNYEIARAYGASVTGALRGAAAAGVMAYFNPAPTPSFTDIAIQGVSLINPNAGRVLRFTQYGIDGEVFKDGFASGMKNLYSYATHEYMNAKVGAELARFASKNGMTLNEFNALLTLNSFIGNKIAGTRYKQIENKIEISGFTSREKGLLGVIWDVNDTILGYQGLTDASGFDYINSGNLGKPIDSCHSLGTLTCNNLVARGYAPSAQLNSLPFGNVAVGKNASMTNLGQLDIVNGGWLGRIFNPFSNSTPCINGSGSGALCHGWDKNYRPFKN